MFFSKTADNDGQWVRYMLGSSGGREGIIDIDFLTKLKYF
jgi:hypothetical protein